VAAAGRGNREDKGTRTRILESCRVLFNERGPAEVTTSEVAAAVGISEGNLHYHFRKKQQIVIALFEDFNKALHDMPAGADVVGPPGTQRRYLSHWFNLMWEWRFLHYANVYRLVVNAWIVGTYWIDYLRVHNDHGPITRDQLRWGFAQLEALFTPYLIQVALEVAE